MNSRMRASWGKPKRKNTRAESALFKPAFQWLFAHGCYVWRHNTGGFKTEDGQFIRFGLKGSADLIGLLPSTAKLPGRFLAVELKSEAGKLTDEQEAFGDRIRASGGVYVVARSIDDLERELKPLL